MTTIATGKAPQHKQEFQKKKKTLLYLHIVCYNNAQNNHLQTELTNEQMSSGVEFFTCRKYLQVLRSSDPDSPTGIPTVRATATRHPDEAPQILDAP